MSNSFQQEQERPEFATISELAENIVFRLPGCDDVMIRKTIQEVYREFCRETKCLTAERRVQLEPGCAQYPLFSVFGGVVTGVRSVAIDTMRLEQKFDYLVKGTSPVVLILAPRWVFVDEPPPPDGMVVPVPTPGEERPRVPFGEEHIHRGPRFMRVLQEEVPSLNSEKTTRGFIEQHGDAICSGVLGRLFAMQKRPWSDPQQAADERMNYENAKSELRMRFEVPPGGRFIDTSQVL